MMVRQPICFGLLTQRTNVKANALSSSLLVYDAAAHYEFLRVGKVSNLSRTVNGIVIEQTKANRHQHLLHCDVVDIANATFLRIPVCMIQAIAFGLAEELLTSSRAKDRDSDNNPHNQKPSHTPRPYGCGRGVNA